MERIEMDNFGPLGKIEYDVNAINLFIGPQASGKSTISKAIYYFKTVRDDLLAFIIEGFNAQNTEFSIRVLQKRLRQKFMDYFGSTKFMDVFCLTYYYSEVKWMRIRITDNTKYINTEFSREMQDGILELFNFGHNEIRRLNQEKSSLNIEDVYSDTSNRKESFHVIRQRCNMVFEDDSENFYIPAGRSIVITLTDYLKSLESRKFDYLTKAFLERINSLRIQFAQDLKSLVLEKKLLSEKNVSEKNIFKAIEKINSILRGSYLNDRDGEKIVIDNSNTYIKINFSSSGQQESLWILMMIFLFILENKKAFLVIEEPEAHLYPIAQKEIVDLIAIFLNTTKSRVIVTTHSPYILSSMNNLIYANDVYLRDKSVTSIVEREYQIDFKNTNAGLVANREIEDIKDYELKQLKAEKIDEASRQINDTYMAIMKKDK